MAKVIQSISIDPDLTAKAKAQGLNISEICNLAIRAALVETRIKIATDEATTESFKKECGYLPEYDGYEEKGYRNLKNSKYAQKITGDGLKKKHPEWTGDVNGLLKYLAQKFEST